MKNDKIKRINQFFMNKYVIIIFITIIIMIGGFFMINKDNNYNEIRHVSMDDIIEIMEKNNDYIILDVRTKEEYNQGHIPNSICIPNETIDEKIYDKLKDKKQLILIYCRSGNRSKQAAEKMFKLGYSNIIEFGGIIDWKGEIEK